MKKFSILLTILLIQTYSFTQDKEQYDKNGKPFVKIFTNFNSTFSDHKSSNAFSITRAYFGYKYNFNEYFSGKILLDVGNPEIGELQMTAFLKNAMLIYTQHHLTINFGLIGLVQFNLQEETWGYRYIYKSFQDQHKFGSSADLGINIVYKPDTNYSIDFTLSNGEGYKKIATDSSLRTGIGTTINFLKFLTFRAYYDFIKKNDVNQQTLSFFAAYQKEDLSFGIEYNRQFNHNNNDSYDLNGFSLYGTVQLDEKWKIFSRYDDLTSNELLGTAWNISEDGSAIIFGFEFAPVKGVKIAPNYQGWNPKYTSNKYITGIFMNLEIKIN